MSNAWHYIKDNWKYVVWGVIPVAILAIIFALPFKTAPVLTTETYWDNEIVSEPYTVSESYTEVEPYVTSETRTETVYDSYINLGSWSHTIEVDKAGSTVSVKFRGYSYYPQYYYIGCPDDEISSCRMWPYSYWGGQSQAKVTIEVSYPEEVTKHKTVTKYRDVTKYREVSTQVLKEKTVTEYVKMSIWMYLFK